MSASPRTSEAEEMRLVTTRGVGDAPLPVKYESAKAALAECASVDECSTWAKKAVALASYARQAGDESLQKMAMKIRARAMRRCGALLNEIPAKAGGRGATHLTSERAAVAEKAGLSPALRKEALRVARIPSADFEAAVESDDPPTVAELAERGTRGKPKPLVDLQGRDPEDFHRALLLRGAMDDLAATVATVTPEALIRGCLPRHHAPMRASAMDLAKWLAELLTLLEAHR